MLGLFSGSVGEADPGWVMGITTAAFTLAGGVMSLIGGGLMAPPGAGARAKARIDLSLAVTHGARACARQSPQRS